MKLKIILVFIVLTLLSSCSKPLPNNKLSYAGNWRSEEMTLLILDDGTVAYERIKNGGSTSINASIKRFDGDDFVVGVWFFTTTFEVSEPPKEINGNWQMVVDGVRLTKAKQFAD